MLTISGFVHLPEVRCEGHSELRIVDPYRTQIAAPTASWSTAANFSLDNDEKLAPAKRSSRPRGPHDLVTTKRSSRREVLTPAKLIRHHSMLRAPGPPLDPRPARACYDGPGTHASLPPTAERIERQSALTFTQMLCSRCAVVWNDVLSEVGCIVIVVVIQLFIASITTLGISGREVKMSHMLLCGISAGCISVLW